MFNCAHLLLLAALPALAGVSWFADGEVISVTEGIGPAFTQRLQSDIVAAVGQEAVLDCRILRLADKSVSWIRSRDLQILCHAGTKFTADSRVTCTSGVTGSGAGSRHMLRLQRLRVADAGRYECQINTEPKMSHFFNLTVLDEPVPVLTVSIEGSSVQRASPGATATLSCSAHYQPAPRLLPVPPLNVHWLKDDHYINVQSTRGGVSLDTERWPNRAVSRLTLADLTEQDAGVYTCSVGDHSAALLLHITEADIPLEVMQRDQSAVARVSGSQSYHSQRIISTILTILLLSFSCS